MREYTVHRPEEAAMRRLLEKNTLNATGAILRLAWLQGLLRDEITNLTWDQVSFLDHQIVLPERTVPLSEEMETYLWEMHEMWARTSEYAVFSERYRKRNQALSRRFSSAGFNKSASASLRLISLAVPSPPSKMRTWSPRISRISVSTNG